MSASELIAATWPDDDLDVTAAVNRLHVAVAMLRKLGLHDILVRRIDGYCLDPNVPLRVEVLA